MNNIDGVVLYFLNLRGPFDSFLLIFFASCKQPVIASEGLFLIKDSIARSAPCDVLLTPFDILLTGGDR